MSDMVTTLRLWWDEVLATVKDRARRMRKRMRMILNKR